MKHDHVRAPHAMGRIVGACVVCEAGRERRQGAPRISPTNGATNLRF